MKNTRKLFAMVLAIVMVMSLAVPAFAAMEGELTGGSITINDAVDGQTYSAYQILYLESYNADAGTYAYKANSAWAEWLATQTDYVVIDEQGYVTWKDGADVAAFAEAAQTQLATKTADATATAANGTAPLSGLKLGYYLVDTTLGTLCSLDTTNPDVEMEEKNVEPTVDKDVKGDDGAYGDENTATIGDTVYFQTTITAYPGAENYVLHDEMHIGLDLNEDSIVVTVGENTLVAGTDYTVAYNVAHTNDAGETTATCDFEITFTQTYLDTITAKTEIVVAYTALLTEDCFDASTRKDPITNDTYLDYGDETNVTSTEKSTTETMTYGFVIVKTDSTDKLLDGATFELYDAQTGGNKIPLVKVWYEEAERYVYRVASAEERAAEGFVSAVIEAEDGMTAVIGLANGTYYLEEVEAPAGYNKLAGRVEVTIENDHLEAVLNDEGDTWTEGGVHIVNQAGTELPSTGGMGTTLFYAFGGIMVLAAVVLLVTKKRMSAM